MSRCPKGAGKDDMLSHEIDAIYPLNRMTPDTSIRLRL